MRLSINTLCTSNASPTTENLICDLLAPVVSLNRAEGKSLKNSLSSISILLTDLMVVNRSMFEDSELGLNALFASYKRYSKLEYDVYGFAKLLIFGRLLRPASECATVRQNQDYYDSFLGEHNPDNVYDTLDFIYSDKDRIIRRMNTNLVKNPIVQMGLFMDDQGLPIAIESFPGNTLDHLTLRTALEKNIDGMDFSRFIFVADRGICCYPNLLHVKDAGNGYIVSKSLLKSTEEERAWTYSKDGYISVGKDFKYKSGIVSKSITDEQGNRQDIPEKVVVYRSAKFQARAEAENRRFLDFLKRLQEHPENFRITAVQSKNLRKFYKKECINEKTGEILDASKIRRLIDFDKPEEYRNSLGYYQIVTSELNTDAREMIDKYHGLTQIEEQFRVMKRTSETRPFFVRTPEHLTAHMMLCLIALIMLRIIQRRIIAAGKVKLNPDTYRSTGLSAHRIQDALLNRRVVRLPGDMYRFVDLEDADLQLILGAFGVKTPAKLYRWAELKHIKTGIRDIM